MFRKARDKSKGGIMKPEKPKLTLGLIFGTGQLIHLHNDWEAYHTEELKKYVLKEDVVKMLESILTVPEWIPYGAYHLVSIDIIKRGREAIQSLKKEGSDDRNNY